MSASFLSSLDIRVLDDCGPRPRLMTLEPFHAQSDTIGTVIVPSGFVFDGASIPTMAMGIVGWPGLRAACLHDYLLDSKVDRHTAAHVFREALEVCGVDEGTVDILYQAVRVYDRYIEQDNPPVEPTGA